MLTENTSLAERAFLQIKKAYETGVPVLPLREIIGDTDIDLAYKVQSLWVNDRIQHGARPVGVKIGLTSKAVQVQLGVNQPDFGILFAHTRIPDGSGIPFSFLMQPKAEAEMAFILGTDITEPISTIEALLPSIQSVCAAIELVGSRVQNWDIRITDTVADNASASHFILGEALVTPERVDFKNAKMKLYKNDELVSEGNAQACMGNPLTAVLWLVNTFLERGVTLKKGDILLSGALGPMVPCAAGDTFRAEIESLGSVQFYITS